MKEHQTSRTLLKSPPELWAECSEAQSLARHLGDSVGEIRITKLEPEHTVAWEGDRASGTVKLEPSGWGTRVTLTCSEPEQEPSDERAPEPEPPPAPPAPEAPSASISEQPPAAPPRARLLERVMRFLGPARGTSEPVAERSPSEPETAQAPETRPSAPVSAETQLAPPPGESAETSEAVDGADALTAALDSLGQAHHRPFSRA
jgi:hypothetical protein